MLLLLACAPVSSAPCMRRWASAAVARAVGHHFRPGAPLRGLVAPAYTAQELHALDELDLDEEAADGVSRSEEMQALLADEDEPDAVYLADADEMTPSLARLVAGTTMAEPQTRNMRTNLELLRRHNSRCSRCTALPSLLLGTSVTHSRLTVGPEQSCVANLQRLRYSVCK